MNTTVTRTDRLPPAATIRGMNAPMVVLEQRERLVPSQLDFETPGGSEGLVKHRDLPALAAMTNPPASGDAADLKMTFDWRTLS